MFRNFFVSIEYKYLGVTTSDEKAYLLSGGLVAGLRGSPSIQSGS